MSKRTPKEITDHLEVVAINHQASFADMPKMVDACKKYDFKICYGLKCFYPYLIEQLKGYKTMVGGSMVLFGTGVDPTEVKIFSGKYNMNLGVDEIDMNMNLGWLRSGMDDLVLKELEEIRKVITVPLKVIIESPTLTEDELKRACQLVAAAKMDYVKTGTGFFGPATIPMVEKMLKYVEGTNCKVKCSGGVKGAAMVEELLDMGVERIGMGYQKAIDVMHELGCE